jgi:hypothetical protein
VAAGLSTVLGNEPSTDADHRAYAALAERDRLAHDHVEPIEVRFPQRDD